MRYRALDGLRAVAILLVLIAHARPSPGMPPYPTWWWHAGDFGNLGVRIFFVISGFIITHLLLQEKLKYGRINIRAFYVRRAFRILPPLIVFMGIVLAGTLAGHLQVPVTQYLLALLFLGNYGGVSNIWPIGHLWSLGVEEQFYLLWPAILAFALKHSRSACWFVLATLVVAPLWRGVCVVGNDDVTPKGFIENSDALAMGAFGALTLTGELFARVRTILEAIPASASGACALLFNCEPLPPLIKVMLLYPLIHLCVVALILRVIKNREDIGGRILSMRPLVFTGIISYSLYLYQQLVFNRPPLEILPKFPWSLALVFLVPAASHYLVELPSITWRNHILCRMKSG